MIYEIDGKFYILVGTHYKEVTVKESKGNFTVVPVKNGKIIERKHGEIKPQIHYREAYKKIKAKELN